MRTLMAATLLLLAVPAAADEEAPGSDIGTGMASYFNREMAGQRTANGEICDPETLTAAHRSVAFGDKIRVTNQANGQSVVVRVNDRGPYTRRRIIDISYAAARAIGMHRSGTARVSLTLLTD